MMKKRSYRKPLMAILLGLAVSSFATSAFAVTYQVKPNDTLVKIAQKKGVSLYQLLRANPKIVNPNLIYSGMTVNLPEKAYQSPVNQPAAKQPTASKPPAQQTPEIGAFAKEVFAIVNQERAKAGLPALKLDSSLSAMAQEKAVDMAKNRYFDHTSPTYGSPFEMMKKYGISYSYAGENIAMGQRTAQEVMTGWMNSQGHRKNILNANYDAIGIGYYNGYWVQAFTGDRF